MKERNTEKPDYSIEFKKDPKVNEDFQIERVSLTEGHRKVVRQQSATSAKEAPENQRPLELRRWKDLLVLSVAFTLIFTAYRSLESLESSLNREDGLGLISLSIIYGSYFVSCLFAPFVIGVLGTKWTLVLCSLCYSVYTAVNFYPSHAAIISASVLVGLAAGPFWAAQGVYLTTAAITYSRTSNLVTKSSSSAKEATINRFNGIFFLIMQSSLVVGNIISSLVLYSENSVTNWTNSSTNFTESTIGILCGSERCPEDIIESIEDSEHGNPSKHLQIILMTIYLVIGLLGSLVLLVFLEKQDTIDTFSSSGNFSRLLDTLKLLKDWKLILLIPLLIYGGYEQALMPGVFNEAYTTCVLGVHFVGFVMATGGAATSFFSLVFGHLNKHFGRNPILFFGLTLHLIFMVAQVLWTPNEDQTWVFYALATAWGMGDAIWQTQVSSLLGVIFSDRQKPAFANLRMWNAIGFSFAYAFSKFVCVDVKLYTGLAILLFSSSIYTLLEILIKSKK